MNKEYIKPSEYSKLVDLHYRTIIAHFNKGFIMGYKDPNTGSIFLKNPKWIDKSVKNDTVNVVLYARVSSTINKDSLDGQIERLRAYSAAKGYNVIEEVKEIASGLNDNRRKLNNILKKNSWDVLLVEHKDRLTRFGFNYFDILNKGGQKVESINNSENKDTEMMEDFVSIVTSFCGRIYGSNRKKKTQLIIDTVKKGM